MLGVTVSRTLIRWTGPARLARDYVRPGFVAPELSVDTLVVGGGVVGLAVAERLLQAFPERSTFVVERHALVGQETTSRNSEVIHAGIYYDPSTQPLKTSLSIRGRHLLYARCASHDIPHRKCGKLILATTPAQTAYLRKLLDTAGDIRARGLGEVPLQWLSGGEVRELEPDVVPGVEGALLSRETGIVSSHELVASLEKGVLESEMGEVVVGTKAVRIDKAEGGQREGWVVQLDTGGERSAVKAKVVVNAAGLNAHHIANQVLPPQQRIQQYYAKGSYFSYRGPGASSVRHLLYPCPDPSTLAGLGTHLTFDLDGNIRFGPDVEWLETPIGDDGADQADFWERHLAVDDCRLGMAVEAVRKYLPGVEAEGFAPDYAGIRPKLSGPGQPAVDFSISHPLHGFINLAGIESPGLTSSLAIAEQVERIVREEVWKA